MKFISAGSAKATGGAISFYGGKTIHAFTSSGNFVAPATFNETVEYVVVGGGGAGGGPSAPGVNSYYGGGGAGAYRKGSTPISTPQTISIQDWCRWCKKDSYSIRRITILFWFTNNITWWWLWCNRQDPGGQSWWWTWWIWWWHLMVDLAPHQQQVIISLPQMQLQILQQMDGDIQVELGASFWK